MFRLDALNDTIEACLDIVPGGRKPPIMAVLEIARGQVVQIPAIQLTNGQEFVGLIKASDGESLVIELEADTNGLIPAHVDEMCVLTWQSDGVQRACPLLVRSRTQRAIVGQVVIQERREAPRIRIEMRISYEPIGENELKDVADEVLAQVNNLGDPLNETNSLLRNNNDPMIVIRDEITTLREMIGEMMVKLDNLTAIVNGGPAMQPLACPSTAQHPELFQFRNWPVNAGFASGREISPAAHDPADGAPDGD